MTNRALLSSAALLFAVSGLVLPADAYEYLTRQDWGASEPVLTMREHQPERLTIHHSGVVSPAEVDLVKKMKGLQYYSQHEGQQADGKTKPVWADVPYHFVIGPDGRVAEGRPIQFAGDTNTEYDPSGHVLITLLGNFEEQKPTQAQLTSLIELLAKLSKRYHIQPETITGHRDQAETACPGQHLQALLPEIKAAVSQLLNSAD